MLILWLFIASDADLVEKEQTGGHSTLYSTLFYPRDKKNIIRKEVWAECGLKGKLHLWKA